MPTFNLAAEARRTRNIRRSYIVLGEVAAPQMLATDLYRSSYLPVINLWTEAGKRIAEEYARTLSAMTQDAPSDVQGQIDAADSAFQRLFFTLTQSLRDWALRVERSVRNRWVRQVYSATSVDLTSRLSAYDVAGTVDSYIAWNTDLIRDVSDQVRQRISSRVFSGLTQRKPAREVAKEISEAVGMGRDRARRIASDQLSKISATLADQRRIEAGIDVWSWVASGKLHYRPHHKERDGNYYSDVPANVGKAVGGKIVNAPPERGDRPSMPPYCGCRSRSVIVYEFDQKS